LIKLIEVGGHSHAVLGFPEASLTTTLELDLSLNLGVKCPLLLVILEYFGNFLIYTRNVIKQVLYALAQKLVTLLQIVYLLIATSDVVVHNARVDWFYHELALLPLNLQDLLSLLEYLNRLLNVTDFIRVLWLLQS
jgi:hypothetical protein